VPQTEVSCNYELILASNNSTKTCVTLSAMTNCMMSEIPTYTSDSLLLLGAKKDQKVGVGIKVVMV